MDKRIYISHDETSYNKKKEIWFIGNEDSNLYRINDKNEVELFMVLPSKTGERFRYYSTCVCIGDNRILCLPDRSDCFLDIEIDTKSITVVKLQNFRGRPFSYCYWVLDNIVWFVALQMNQIIEYDLDSKKINGQYDVFDGIGEEVGSQSSMENGVIYCISRKSCILSMFDTEKKEKNEILLPTDSEGFETVFAFKNKLYLTGYNKKVICWDLEKQRFDSILEVPKEYALFDLSEKEVTSSRKIDVLFYKTLLIGKRLIFAPWNTGNAHTKNPMLLYYDLEKKNLDVIKIDIIRGLQFRLDNISSDVNIRLNFQDVRKIIDYNLISGAITEVRFTWKNEKKAINEMAQNNQIISERKMSIQKYLKALVE